MDPAPQGGVEVRSAPKGSRKGRRSPDDISGYDWDEITDYVRIGNKKIRYDYVSAGQVPELRKRYPDFKFEITHVHLYLTDTSSTSRKVCQVTVSMKAAGDDSTEIEP